MPRKPQASWSGLGCDLQYIRINRTVVGAAVGLALHAIVVALS